MACNSFAELAVKRDYFLDRRCFARGQHPNGIAWTQYARCYLAGKSSKIEIGPVDPLYRHTQWLGLIRVIIKRDGLQMRDHRLPRIPWHMDGRFGDIIAFEAGYRHGGKVAYADAAGKCGIFGDDCIIFRLIIVDQVHLVHGKYDVSDAQ